MNVKYLIALVLFLTSIKCFTQDFKGQILDEKDGNPISYVNVGVLGKSIGTVSDINGNFNLSITPHIIDDTLQISCIGFYSISYQIKDLFDSSNKKTIKIVLKPKDYEIKEVVIRKDKLTKSIVLGNPIKDNNRCRLMVDSALGAELGLIIRLPKKSKRYLLKEFTFNLSDHDFNSEARVNIYNIVNSLPSDNILKESIFISIPNNKEILTIDLLKYNIVVDEDFFICIEHFRKNPDMSKRLKFNCVLNRRSSSGCYSRKVSQGGWTEIKNVGVQFKITAYDYR